MPNKNKTKAPDEAVKGLVSRAEVRFMPDTIREEDHSVEFVLASEEPAAVFDPSLFRVVNEVLVSSGMEMPPENRLPLQDSHRRESVDDNLGSVREIRRENSQIVGRLYFDADDPKALKAFNKVKNRHLDSGSITYRQLASVWIDRGESLDYLGATYAGPLLLTKAWEPKEFSLLAIGADKNSKARSELEAEQITETTSREAVDNTLKEKTKMDETTKVEQPQIDIEVIRAEAVKAEQARAAKITDLCTRHDLTALAPEMIRTGVSIEKAQEEILAKLAERSPAIQTAVRPEITAGKEASEKFREAATDGLILRSGMRLEKPAEGAQQLRALGFADLARACLEEKGTVTRNMGREELLTRALSTSDFPNILANVANKSQMIGYRMGRQSWRIWARVGQLPNFLAAKRIRLSDAPEMKLNYPGEEIEQGVVSDTGEEVQLQTFARKLVITRQALINDDVGIFNTIFRAFGARAANQIEAAAYYVLNNGSAIAMADTGNIFNTTAVTTTGGHANMASSGGVVTTTTVNAAQIAIGAQKGEQGTVLGIMPKYLIGGMENKVAIELLCNSTVDTTLTGNANFNPFAGYEPVISPHVSGKKWFMLCDQNEIDTVEVSFLDGRDTPTLYQVDNQNDILGRSFVGYIDYKAKALEWRSMYYNAGS